MRPGLGFRGDRRGNDWAGGCGRGLHRAEAGWARSRLADAVAAVANLIAEEPAAGATHASEAPGVSGHAAPKG